jgi:hypothetical protein
LPTVLICQDTSAVFRGGGRGAGGCEGALAPLTLRGIFFSIDSATQQLATGANYEHYNVIFQIFIVETGDKLNN